MVVKADYIADLLEKDEEEADPLVITPRPDLAKLRVSGSASVDLRLGSWFLMLRRARVSCMEISSTNSERENIEQFTRSVFIRFGDEFVLHPRSFVLGATLEWIRMPTNMAGIVTGKSSWGRRGLIIATATGVHPGFTGCLTLEITNLGEIPIKIRPGMSICQLFLHRAEGADQTGDTSLYNGKRRPVLLSIPIDNFSKKLSEDS